MAEQHGVSSADLKHALKQTMSFYDKDLTDQQWAFWWSVLSKLDPMATLAAIRDYVGVGKYAPRPAHIVELVEEHRQARGTYNRHEETREPVPCPPEIADAWRWYIGTRTKESQHPMFQKHAQRKLDSETQERYLQIVNQEAYRAGQPDAVADEHKLKSVWGDQGAI